jgi:phosphatidylglycerol lysyltransferase
MASGGALRYRMYAPEGLSIREVGAVILLVAMPYVFGVGWLIDLSLLLHLQDAARAFKLPVAIVAVFGVFGLAKDVGWLAFVASRKEPITIRGQSIRLPSLRDALAQIAFGLVQISLMTTILYLFMPPELNMTWPAFVAIYCISFVAGQVSNVPAGLGVLEAALFLLLPHVPPGKLVSAVLAYRAVYELIPLGVALSLLLIYETTNKAGIIRKRFRTSGSSP